MLKTEIPTYREPLQQAQALRAQADADSLQKAVSILLEARKFYVDAMPLGEELAVVLTMQDKTEAVHALLTEMKQDYGDATVEMLCRFGKLHKKLADSSCMSGSAATAINQLEIAEKYYAEAFENSKLFYPRINQLTMRFLRAALLKGFDEKSIPLYSELLQQTRQEAQELLQTPSLWTMTQSDDSIWVPATMGEAHLLLGQYAQAETSYRTAMKEANGKKFYFDCMAAQVKMLAKACDQLGQPIVGDLATPDTFFTLPKVPS